MAEEKKVRTEELILEARNFFNTYKKQIGKYVRAGKNVITVNFNDLAGFSHELSEMLINNPEEALQVLEVALEESGLVSNPRARFSDFPESYLEKIRNLRAKHLNKLIMVEGIVRQASEVRPQVVNAKFECPSCGTRMSVLQIESRFREPTRCSCGRKGGFKPVSKDMVDAQRLVIEESSESLTGGEQPRRISVFLKEDLVEPKMEEKTTPGSKINVIGILKEVIKHTQTGGQLTRYDIAIEANNLIPLEETFEEFDISEEDERQIQELAADPHVFKRFADSIAPSIYGYDEIKQCLVLQLFGGVKKTRSDGTSARGDLHVLLVGDPGTAKSVTLKFISQIAPKGRYVAGRGTSVDYNEPLLIRENNKQKFVKIGEFIDRFYNDGEEGFIPCSNDIEALSLNLETLKLEWKPVKALLRHENKEKLLSFSLETGRRIKVTKDHSIFCIEKGEIRCKPSNELKIGDYVIIPKIIPSNEFDLAEDVAKFLGYFIAEGNLYNRDGSYKIQFTLNKNEINIASEIKKVSEKYFKKEAKISEHGKNGMRLVIYGKEPYFMVCSWLGNIAHKLAKDKGIPEIVLNSNQQARHAFFDSYILGDAGVTKSERLMSELLYLKLQDKIIASCVETKMNKISLIENREIIDKGSRFDLKSPKINREFKNLRLNFPINCLPDNLKILFKKKLKSEYSRINLERIDNKMLFERMIRIFREEKLPGKRIRELFGKNSVEYFSEHSELFLKEKKGREIEISLTKEGTDIIKNVLKLRKLLDSDVSFVKIKKIEETEPTNKFVYDISTCEENFVAGFGGIVCHNTGAGLTATVVRDEFLRGWALEAGAMVLSNKGIVCLHPNSNIIADNKVIKIEELFNEKTAKKAVSNGEKIEISNLSIKIPSLLGNSLKFGFEDANLIRRKKYKGKMLKLRLESGFSFSLTPEHKLIDGNNLQWKEAKEFKKDDFLLAPLKLPENNSELYILDILPDNWIVCLEKSEKEELKKLILKRYKSLSDFNKKYNLSPNYFSGGKQLKIEIFKKILNELGIYEQWKNKTLKYGRSKAGESLKISKITPQLAYFMGFVYGDGNIEINKKHSSVQIVQSTKNEKQIEKIKCFFESFSDRDLGEYKRLSKSEIRERKLNSEHLILYSSSNFLSWLCEFFTKENLSNIFLMNNECLKAFIAGCLDSDGCISIKNCEKNGKNYKIAHIEFLLTNNERANKNFMLALRRFDCYSKLIQKKPISIVRITGRGDVVTLLNEISLYSVKTKEIPVMKKAISSISSKLPLEPVSKICLEIIRNCEKKEELNELGISSIIYDYKNKKIQPSREQLLKIKEKLNLPNEIKKEIEILLKKDFFIDKIVGIKEEVYEGYVYDIFVPKTHNFVCEGVVVHNCIDEIEKMDEQDRSAMHEAMEQQCVSISKANVQACYSEDTEVLTETGWKKYTEVKEEKIAQYNLKDKTIQFLPHKGIYTYDYNGKMYHFKNGKNDILVTPNHKMLAREFSQKNLRAIEAQNLYYNYIKFVNSGDYIGQEKEYFILPAIKHKQNRKHPKYVHQHIDKEIPMDLWLEFLGYYLTEGGIETPPTIGITQKKGKNADKIQKCLKKLTELLGCSLSEVDCKKYIRYKITQTQLYEYLKNLGRKCHLKKSNLNFSLLSKRQLKILFEALMLGDGSSDKKYFNVTSKELSDELQIIAHLIGKSASQNIHYLKGSRKNRKTLFRVSISSETEPSIRKKDIKIIDYRGKVFCFSTETGFFVTRRNGKIAIQGNSLRAETSVLAAGNPKFGRFDPYQTVASQIDIPPALINRFDVIFIMKDIPDRAKDEAIATHVLLEHKEKQQRNTIDRELFRKYIAYSKQKIKPQLSDEAVDEIKKFYVELRNTSIASDQPTKPLPISARQLEALIRMSEAMAKLRLSSKVSREDAKATIELMKFYLYQVGYDYETKTFDIDRIATGVSTSQRSKIILVREALSRLESRIGKFIPIEEVKKELEEKVDEKDVDDALDKLTISGDIFHPRKGFVQRM